MVSLDEEIKELQELKKNLKLAKEITLEVGAEVFNEYGIEKLEGAGISSITLSKSTISKKVVITPIDEELLISSGFYKKVLDVEAIKQAYEYDNYTDLIQKACEIETVTEIKPSKLKVNKKRVANNNLPQLEKVA